jgi:hypothetical protein
MEYGVQSRKYRYPCRLTGYINASVQYTQTMQEHMTCMTMLTSLKCQKGYLNDLLSKTAMTLNALRDKQGRNYRLLGSTLGPRSKKKKILQNQWRTDKTIKTCENEEKVILDCLRVCENNIRTLEFLVYPMGLCTTAAEYNLSNSKRSYIDSASTDFNWNGWADEVPVYPFHRQKYYNSIPDELPPDGLVEGPVQWTVLGNPNTPGQASAPKRPTALTPRVHYPPTTALPELYCTVLSPEATSFEPHSAHFSTVERARKELDKLSISGLLASKRTSQIVGRRFSDVAVGHMFQHLSINDCPDVGTARGHKSWGPDSKQYHASVSSAVTAARVKRTRSVS